MLTQQVQIFGNLLPTHINTTKPSDVLHNLGFIPRILAGIPARVLAYILAHGSALSLD
jgi:hypothetical protein